jgi:DNA/RNA-binding domain of Phe-tRNA-synthetase-like protein
MSPLELAPQTTDAIIVIDALPPMTRADVERATTELAQMVQTYCGGAVETDVRVAT